MRTILGFASLTWLVVWIGCLPHRALLGGAPLLRDALATLAPLAIAIAIAVATRPHSRTRTPPAEREEWALLIGLLLLGAAVFVSGHPVPGLALAGLGAAVCRPAVDERSARAPRLPRIVLGGMVATLLIWVLWPSGRDGGSVDLVWISRIGSIAAQNHVGSLLLLSTLALAAAASARRATNDEDR